MMLNSLRVYLAGMRILLPYAAFGVVLIIGSAVIGGLMDGDSAGAISRRAYRSSAWAVGVLISLTGFIVCLEFMRDYLRHASSSPLYHWRSTVIRVALRVGLIVAVLWCAGDVIGEALRGLWGMEWDPDEILRGAVRSAAIGGLLGCGSVVFEAVTMDAPARGPGAA